MAVWLQALVFFVLSIVIDRLGAQEAKISGAFDERVRSIEEDRVFSTFSVGERSLLLRSHALYCV